MASRSVAVSGSVGPSTFVFETSTEANETSPSMRTLAASPTKLFTFALFGEERISSGVPYCSTVD